jgi:hypothetical protein
MISRSSTAQAAQQDNIVLLVQPNGQKKITGVEQAAIKNNTTKGVLTINPTWADGSRDKRKLG